MTYVRQLALNRGRQGSRYGYQIYVIPSTLRAAIEVQMTEDNGAGAPDAAEIIDLGRMRATHPVMIIDVPADDLSRWFRARHEGLGKTESAWTGWVDGGKPKPYESGTGDSRDETGGRGGGSRNDTVFDLSTSRPGTLNNPTQGVFPGAISRQVLIPFSAFRGVTDLADWAHVTNELQCRTGLGLHIFTAPLTVSPNMTLLEMDMRARRDTSSGSVICVLRKVDASTKTDLGTATLTGTGTSEVSAIVTPDAATATKTYYLYLTMDPDLAVGDVGFEWVKLTYTFLSAYHAMAVA